VSFLDFNKKNSKIDFKVSEDMKRKNAKFLLDWIKSTQRKPLIIRGARQVGKTWLIRDFAKKKKLELVELNFEKQPELESLFLSNEAEEILLNLRSFTKCKIIPKKSLLFLDEIQAAPKILAKLRWFYEDMPDLAVIAAGSLLEFTLADHNFSMPVGRINYMYLEPLSFEEFLDANNLKTLKSYIENYNLSMHIPKALHLQFMKALKEYTLIGGMPAAVLSWIEEKNLDKVSQIHVDLLSTYRDDFAKYSKHLSVDRLEEIMAAIPKQLGKKFVYSKVNPNVSSNSLKQAFDLLTKAKVAHFVYSSSSNGLPLGAEVNEKYFKAIFLDCGLASDSLGFTLKQLKSTEELILINSGGIAEQIVGQQLRTIFSPFMLPSLHYWQRAEKKSNAEIDYVFQYDNQIIPIEVKAGSSGSLKSLHQFMKEKKKKLAVRINSDYPSKVKVNVKDSLGSHIEYTLISIPFYLIGQLHRLIEDYLDISSK
jgi:hypothetical protein